MFWLFLSCLAVANLFSYSAAAVSSAKTNPGSHSCATPCVRDSWALRPSIKLPAHEREIWTVVPWDDKRSWSPEQTWACSSLDVEGEHTNPAVRGKAARLRDRAVGPCSASVPGCARLPLPCPQGWAAAAPGCWETWQPGHCSGQLLAWGMARAAWHTYGGRVTALLSQLQTLPLHPPPEGNVHILLLLPLAGLPGWEVALQNLCSETALLLVLAVDFHYSKNWMLWAWSHL